MQHFNHIFCVPYCKVLPYLWYSSISLSVVTLTVYSRGGEAARDSASPSPHGGSSVPNRTSAGVLMGLSDRCVWVWMCVYVCTRKRERRENTWRKREKCVCYNLWKAKNCSWSSSHNAMAHSLKPVISIPAVFSMLLVEITAAYTLYAFVSVCDLCSSLISKEPVGYSQWTLV